MSIIEESLKAADVIVIVALWALKFIGNWLQTLTEHTSEVVYGDFTKSDSFERYADLLLFGKCALACILAFIVDAYNHKFAVVFGGVCVYVLTPVFALCMCITQKQIYCFLTLAAASIMFVTSPAAFSVIFSQKKSPVRFQVRRLVSIMEFAEGLLLITAGATIPETAAHNGRYSMIARWVIILPFFIFILTVMERIWKYVSPERVRERGVVAIFNGIHNDIRRNAPKTGLSKMNFLVFVLLLFPAFSISLLGSVVGNLKSDNDTQFQHPSLKKLIHFGQLTVIPVCEVAVSFSPLPELLAEMLVLGLAHVMNIGVLTFLVVRMNTGGVGQHRSVIADYGEYPQNTLTHYGFAQTAESSFLKFNDFDDVRSVPAPDEKSFVYLIVNPTWITVFLEDDPAHTLFSKVEKVTVTPGHSLYGDVNMTGVEQTISIIARPFPPTAAPPFRETIKFKEKKVYCLFFSINDTKLDLVVASDEFEIPKFLQKPILIVQNTFVGGDFWGKRLRDDHELTVTTGTGRTIYIEILPNREKSLSLVVPVGKLNLVARYIGKDPAISLVLKDTAYVVDHIEPSSCYIITINVNVNANNEYSFLGLAKLFETKPPKTTPAPPRPDNPDKPDKPDKPEAAVQTAYAVLGATLGLTSVGYIHFFWMGCPVRLRATIYAWFLASNEILGWIAAYVFGHEIGTGEGIGLLIMAVITAAWHFAFGWYYEHKITPDALKRRRSSSAAIQRQN